MKVEVVEKEGRPYIKLTPIPHKTFYGSLKISHYSYDIYRTIKKGKRYYPLENSDSLKMIIIQLPHSRNSPIFTDEIVKALKVVSRKGVPITKLSKWLGATKKFISQIIK